MTSRGPRLRAGRFLGTRVTLACLMSAALLSPSSLGAFAEIQSSESKAEMAASEFQRFVSDYLSDLYSRHPVLAASSGLHSWDDRLEDYSQAALVAEAASIKKFQLRLEKIPALSLGLSELFDHEILAANMKARLLELEHIKSYERNPQIYSDLISNNLLLLALFDYAPLDVRLKSVIAKEKQIPRLVESAQSNIHNPPAALIKAGLASLRGVAGFVRTDLPGAFASVRDVKLQAELKKTTAAAASTISDFIRRLERMKPSADATFALGKQNLEAKLRFEDGIDIPIETLLKIANRELLRTQEEFRRAAAGIDPRRDAMKVWAGVQAGHPKAGSLVDEAGKQLDTLERFLREKKIVTLPSTAHPIVSASPEFMRWATASEWGPGPFAAAMLSARYFITDVDPKWSAKEKEEYLAAINYPQLWATSIHETYPGHFVQDEFLKRVSSVVRRSSAFAPVSFVEGWAHYTEQMMIEEGFGSNDPKIKLGQLADALLRLCRTVVGIREHTQGMTVDQGARFFMENAYVGETPARLEAERGTFDPSYILYSIGKLAILKMREDYRRSRGGDYSLDEFHDRLLSNGLAPLWIHRQMLMPDDKSKLL